MPPEVEHLLGDGKLKAIGKGKGDKHGSNADDRRCDCKPDDEAGEGPFPVECDATGYKGWCIQIGNVIPASKITGCALSMKFLC